MPRKPGTFEKNDPRINRKGRLPGKISIPDLLKRIGAENIKTGDGEMQKLEVVMRKVFKYAVEGKSWAVQFIADRMEGKPAQSLELSGGLDLENATASQLTDDLLATIITGSDTGSGEGATAPKKSAKKPS
jgi:hypothetical protein